MKNYVSEITTANLRLRMLGLKDAVALQRLLASNKDYMIPWVPWAGQEPESVETKKERIRTWKGEFYLDQKYTYGIFDKENHQLIGLIFLLTRQGEGILEIGYIIDHEQTGKGYATEASYALTKLGFKHIGIDKMVIICSPLNKASARVPEKLGYHLESVQKSVVKNERGERNESMVWAMFIEVFEPTETYEPVDFLLEGGM